MYRAGKTNPSSFFSTCLSQHHLLKRPFFLPLNNFGIPVENQLTINLRVYFKFSILLYWPRQVTGCQYKTLDSCSFILKVVFAFVFIVAKKYTAKKFTFLTIFKYTVQQCKYSHMVIKQTCRTFAVSLIISDAEHHLMCLLQSVCHLV